MLSKDMIMKIGLELNNKDILALCKTSQLFNKYICENQSFWLNKIRKEYPEVVIKDKNYKELYMEISKDVEIIINIVIESTQYEEDENGDEYLADKRIEVDGRLEFKGVDSIEKIKERIKKIVDNFFQSISLYGVYNVIIDDVQVCQDRKFLSSCFDSVDKNTDKILIVLETNEDIDELDEPHYQNILKEIIEENY